MRRNNSYVQFDPAMIEKARQMDLLTYLRHYEPSNLRRVGGNAYCTREHDSLKISNGTWYWWSRGFGGVSALDYLIKVKEYSFVEAVQTLTGEVAHWIPPPPAVKKDEPKELLLPKKNKSCDRVIQYLFGRGIDYQLIQDCVADGTIFESAEYHNAVFVGKDESGTPKYAACRSTFGRSFMEMQSIRFSVDAMTAQGISKKQEFYNGLTEEKDGVGVKLMPSFTQPKGEKKHVFVI